MFNAIRYIIPVFYISILGILISYAQESKPKGVYVQVLPDTNSTGVKIDTSRTFKIGDRITRQVIPIRERTISKEAKALLSRPLQDRVVPISDKLLKCLQDSSFPSFKKRWPNLKKWRAYEPTDKEREMIAEVVGQLPKSYQSVLEKQVSAFYLAENLDPSAMLRWEGYDNEHLIGHLIVSSRLFEQSVADFLNYKESTAFSGSDTLTQIKIEVTQDLSALWYVLFHETTHIIHRNGNISPFTKDIWYKYKMPKRKFDFTWRGQMQFYGDQKAPKNEAYQIYQDLSKTPFSSLYASLNWTEDFAEFGVLYYMTQMMNLPYRIVVSQNGQESFAYAPFENPMVLERYRGVKELLQFE